MILMRSKNCLKFTILMRSRGPHQNPEFKAIFLQIATKIANFPLDLIKIMNLRQVFYKLPQKSVDLIKIVNLRQFSCKLPEK